MENKEYIIGIDIGSSSVVMAVGVRNEGGDVSLLGVEVQNIEDCVKDGDVTNYIVLGNAIAKAKATLEGELGRKINSAYVAISGRSVYCVRYEDYVDIKDKTNCVTENELRELNARIEMVVPGGGDEIIDRIPLCYTIDDHQTVIDPFGAYGNKLSATYLFVLVGKQQIDLVNRALHRADIKACGFCVSPTLLPQLLLSDAESEEGVAIVDIGSDLTDIAVVKGGKLWYFSSLPIGASAINNDLHEFLKISKKDIDQLKKRYGSATADGVPDNTTVPVKTAGHAKKQILQRNIAEIAEERLKDIARLVMRELKAAKFSTKIPCGIVLTGGSAYLSNIDQLFARELQMEVRFGQMLNGLDDNSQERVCAFLQSVAVGLLIYGAKHNACETQPDVVRIIDKGVAAVKSSNEEQSQSGPTIFSQENEVKPQEVAEITPVETLKNEKPVNDGNDSGDTNGESEESDNDGSKAINEIKSVAEQSKTDKSRKPKWYEKVIHWVDDVFSDEYI